MPAAPWVRFRPTAQAGCLVAVATVLILAFESAPRETRGVVGRERTAALESYFSRCGCPQPACVPCAFAPEPFVPQATVPQAIVQNPYVQRPCVQSPTVPSPYVPAVYCPDLAVPEPYVPQLAIAEPYVPQVHVADPTVADPKVVDPHVLEPHLPGIALAAQPHVAEPVVSDVHVKDPKVDAADVEQEQEAVQDGKPLLRQQPGPDAPQTRRARETAALLYNNAMNLANNQYAAAQYSVYQPCFTYGSSCASAQSGQQMLSSGLPDTMQRGVHMWASPRGSSFRPRAPRFQQN